MPTIGLGRHACVFFEGLAEMNIVRVTDQLRYSTQGQLAVLHDILRLVNTIFGYVFGKAAPHLSVKKPLRCVLETWIRSASSVIEIGTA